MEINRGDDLFNKLGNKDDKNSTAAEGAAKAEPAQPEASAGDEVNKVVNAKSDNLTGESEKSNQPGAEVESSDSKKKASKKDEPSGSDKAPIQDPETWDEDSKFKEIKKLREENKAYRQKYQEKLEALKSEADQKLEAEREKVKEYEDAKKELDKLKAQEEDKKRDLNEKLTHRESRIAELEAYMDSREKEYNEKMSSLQTKLQELEADREVRLEGYRNRVQEELDLIPEKFKDYANLIVKGAEDPQDALVSLQEAKMKGLFEDKKVVVNHSVPNASQGARTSQDQIEAAKEAERKSLNASQKIKAGLDDIFKSGQSNSAFKTR